MSLIHVERIGGLAGFGGVGAHVRSRGQLDLNKLPVAEQKAVEALFKSHAKPESSQVRDGFRLRISRTTSAGTETIEIPETAVPSILTQCVEDKIV